MDLSSKDNPGAGRLQDEIARVVVDNPQFEQMPSEPAPGRIRAARGLEPMPDEKLMVREKTKASAQVQVMDEFREPPSTPSEESVPNRDRDMEPHPDAPADAVAGGGYVRLRVRVTADQMRIVAAQRVEGPLAQPAGIVGDHAYEVTLDGTLLAREGLPDIGVSRSYPRKGQAEHHLAMQATVEFNMRVPLERVPQNALPRLRLSLFRFPDASARSVSGLLVDQLGQQARLVASIDGVSQARIEPQALEQLRGIFPSSFPGRKR